MSCITKYHWTQYCWLSKMIFICGKMISTNNHNAWCHWSKLIRIYVTLHVFYTVYGGLHCTRNCTHSRPHFFLYKYGNCTVIRWNHTNSKNYSNTGMSLNWHSYVTWLVSDVESMLRFIFRFVPIGMTQKWWQARYINVVMVCIVCCALYMPFDEMSIRHTYM